MLHGMGHNLVRYLKELFASLELVAEKVLDLPSLKMSQDRRVDYYIKSCGIPLVVVSFDETEKHTRKSRPNVYDEIARCTKLRKKDFIILRQRKGATAVELPSNIEGQVRTIIEYEAEKFERAIPRLLSEIKSRGFLTTRRETESRRNTGTVVNRFLDKMDRLWDAEFDAAWERIHTYDPDAESRLAIYLDKFFQEYHRVFDALVRKKKSNEELAEICENAYTHSVQHVADAWTAVVDSKRREAERAHLSDPKSRHGKIYENALREYRKIERADTEEIKIAKAKSVIVLFQEYLKLVH